MQGTNNHHHQHHNHHHQHHRHHGRQCSRRNPEDSHANLSTESCPESCSSRSSSEVVDVPFSSSSRTDNDGGGGASGSPRLGFAQKHHAHHHHHSIHELKRYLGKMMTHWIPERGNRRSSCSDDGNRAVEEEFRGRSQSLDGAVRRGISDCEATYRIYESILKEGT